MARASLLPVLLLLPTLLTACGDKDPAGDSGATDTDADTDTDTDGGDTGSTELAWGDATTVKVTPSSFDTEETASLEIWVEAHRPELVVAEWSAKIGETELDLVPNYWGEDFLILKATVEPGTLTSGLHISKLSANGVEVAAAPMHVAMPAAEAAAELDPSPGLSRFDMAIEDDADIWFLDQSGVFFAEDDDADFDIGMWTGPIIAEDDVDWGDPVFTWSRVDADGSVSEDHDVFPHLKSTHPSAARMGSTTVDDGTGNDSVLAWFYDDVGAEAYRLVDGGDGGSFKELSLAIDRDGGMPDRVLGVAPVTLSDAPDDLALVFFGLSESDDGRWGGVYHDGRKPYTWSALGSTTPDAVAEGKAFVGIVQDGDDRFEPDGTGRVLYSFDSSRMGADCSVKFGLHELVGGRVSDLRTVVLSDSMDDEDDDCRAFGDVRAVAATAHDVDRDGWSDVVVRVWGVSSAGDATHSDHLVPDAFNPEARSTSVRLDAATDAPGYRPATHSTGLTGQANSVLVPPATKAQVHGGGGAGWLSLDGIAFSGALAEGETPGSWLEIRNTWKLDELAEYAAASERGTVSWEAGSSGVVGRSAKSGGNAPASCSGNGVCHMGRCFCVSGSGSRLLSTGAGDGAATADTAEFAVGDLVQLTDLGGGPLAHRTSWGDTVGGEQIIASRSYGDDWMEIYLQADGRTTDVTGEVLTTDSRDMVMPVDSLNLPYDHGSGGFVAAWTFDDAHSLDSSFAPPYVTASRGFAAVDISDRSRTVKASLPADTAKEGTTPITVLGDISTDGGLALFWRDGTGQAWLGVADIESAWGMVEGELPFLAGPMAIGEADPAIFEDLALGSGRPLAVAARLGPSGDAVMSRTDEARAFRLDEWVLEDECLGSCEDEDSAWRLSEDGDPAKATVIYVTGRIRYSETSGFTAGEVGCPYATVALPVAAIGDELWEDEAEWHTAAELDCSDLAVPLAAGDLLPDSSQVVVLAKDGELLLEVLADGEDAHTILVENPTFESGGGVTNNILYDGMASSGDIDGDGLDDVLIRGWGSPAGMLLSSKGSGGLELVEAAGAVKLIGALGSSTPVVKDTGGGGYTVAGTMVTSVQWPFQLELRD